jgi:protein transport protein SEC61 subunit gamma-like protein
MEIEVEEKPNRLKRFVKETYRVLKILKKPNREEYIGLVKITGLGIAIIGAIGFIIFLVKQLVFS